MKKKTLVNAVIVLLVSYATLLAIFVLCGPYYNKMLFPIYRWEIELLSSDIRVLSTDLVEFQGQEMVSLVVEITKSVPNSPEHTWVERFRWPPINSYVHAIILFSLLAAWPKIALKDRLRVFLMGLPVLFVIETIDIPLLTVIRCEAHAYAKLVGESAAQSGRYSYWLKFLNSGGREFLSILGALCTLAIFHLMRARKIPEVGRNDPCPCGSGKKYKNCCLAR